MFMEFNQVRGGTIRVNLDRVVAIEERSEEVSFLVISQNHTIAVVAKASDIVEQYERLSRSPQDRRALKEWIDEGGSER